MFHFVLVASLPTQYLIVCQMRTAEELVSELLRGPTTTKEVLSNINKLITLARRIGATKSELEYLTWRRNYIALNRFGSMIRQKINGTKKQNGFGFGVGISYLEAHIRTLTLCEIYAPHLVKEIEAAIMAG